jgi:probable F420-dependent oxidoreductase
MNQPFRFGVVVAQSSSHATWIATARRIEELGYATLLMPDRPTFGGLAPLTALAVAAEATTSLRVGSYVFCNPYRNPLLLAREAATLDLLSDGRFELGLGAGVAPAEFERMGIPFMSAGMRVDQLAEALQVLKQLFTEDTINFRGKHYTITEMRGSPRPIQQPHMPIMVAGTGERMLRLAAREANIIAVGSRITEQGADPADASLDQKIGWIKEAAGDRFAELELSQTIFDIAITDSGVDISSQGVWQPFSKRQITTAQAVVLLEEQRERYGFSYLQLYEGQIENFAPVVAQLAGR